MTSADCQLKVWRLSEGRFNPLAETELVGLWKRFDIDITSTEKYQVRLIFLMAEYT